VVNGPPCSYELVTNLRKIRAPNGANQNKIPASQRKAVFNLRFLVIELPFHNREYLGGVGEKVMADLGEELRQGSESAIPVYHTENGGFYDIF
jgi:fatty acid synthase subunit alpha